MDFYFVARSLLLFVAKAQVYGDFFSLVKDGRNILICEMGVVGSFLCDL